MREKFEQRRILLRAQEQVERAIEALTRVPLDPAKPLELIIREPVQPRRLDQNARLWAGPLRDIAEQVQVEGRRFSEKVWHEHFKGEFLPDVYDPDHCRSETYQKWATKANGEVVLVASSTDLTVKGFARFMEQVYAFGAQQGVEFHEPEQRDN